MIFFFHLFFMFISILLVNSFNEVIIEFPLGLSSGFDFSFHFLFDFYSIVFLRFVMLISSVVMIYIRYYIRGDNSEVRFSILVLLFIVSMGILILSPSLLRIMIG